MTYIHPLSFIVFILLILNLLYKQEKCKKTVSTTARNSKNVYRILIYFCVLCLLNLRLFLDTFFVVVCCVPRCWCVSISFHSDIPFLVCGDDIHRSHTCYRKIPCVSGVLFSFIHPFFCSINILKFSNQTKI